MTPAEWRAKEGKTLEEVASILEVSSLSTVRRYESGEREAPNGCALAWVTASGGAVTAEEINGVRQAWLRKEAARKEDARKARQARARKAARKSHARKTA